MADTYEKLERYKRRTWPFFVEFMKFTTAFAVIIVVALVAIHVADAAMR